MLLTVSTILFISAFWGSYYIETKEYPAADAALFWMLLASIGLVTLNWACTLAKRVYQFESLHQFRNIILICYLFFGGWLANNTWYNYYTFTSYTESKYSLYQNDDSPNHFVFQGDLELGAGTFVIRSILNAENIDIGTRISIEMHSEGGKPSEAIILGEFIAEYDVSVEVLGKCISACSMVLLSSNHRYVHPKAWIGFHSSYNKDTENNVSYDSKSLNFYNKHLEKLLKNVGASDGFIQDALVEDASGGFFPSYDELEASGVVNKKKRTNLSEYDFPTYLAGE